jgi:integrase
MRGTKRERQPGVWELRVYLGRDRDGKPHQRSITFRGTTREAESELARLVASASGSNAGVLGPRTTVREALEAWEKEEWPELSPTTTRRYEGLIRCHILPAVGNLEIRKTTPLDFERLFVSMKRAGAADASIRQARAVLGRALKLARKWSDGRLHNPVPDAELPRARARRAVRSPDDEEVLRLIAGAETYDPRFGLFVRLAAVTGARRAELCALRWGDVDWEHEVLRIDEAAVTVKGGVKLKDPKNETSERTVALDTETLQALRARRLAVDALARRCEVHAPGQGAFVFSTDPTGATAPHPDSFSKALAVVRTRAGLPADLHLHSLRHWASTLLDPVVSQRQKMARLGHSTAPTSNRYTHQISEEDRRAASYLAGRLNPGAAGPR